MAKLRLNPEALQVQSFEMAEPGTQRGTVAGHAELTGPVEEKSNAETCARSCGDGGSCYVTWCWEDCWYTVPRDRG